VRFHATHTTQDRILEKYREKLSRKAKEFVFNPDRRVASSQDSRQGLGDITSLKEAYKAKIEATKQAERLKKPTASVPAPSPQDSAQVPFQPPPPPEPQSASTSSSKPKKSDSPIQTLSSFIDVEKTLKLPPKEIELIWRLRHANSENSLCAVIPAVTYAHIALMARKHPQFVLPVPREGQGAEIHFLQWTFPQEHTATVLFTQLAEYKMRGEYASPHTTLSLHTELLQEKGLVLAQGSVQESRGMTAEDGKWLLMCLQKFYGAQVGQSQERRILLEQFSNGDPGFQIEKLLDEAERIG